MANRWLRGHGDPRADCASRCAASPTVYAEHGLVLHAIADAAGHDPEVERVYHGLIERFVDGDRGAHRARHRGRRIAPLDAAPTAAARSCG